MRETLEHACWQDTSNRTNAILGDLGGAANAYIPSLEEERKHRQEKEAELKRVRTASKDRVKEIEKEQKERNQSPAS